ncbi:hypothetical protein D3C78_1614230 [compost metagenome]
MLHFLLRSDLDEFYAMLENLTTVEATSCQINTFNEQATRRPFRQRWNYRVVQCHQITQRDRSCGLVRGIDEPARGATLVSNPVGKFLQAHQLK